MSICNFKSFKIGQSSTATQNFVLQSQDDGTITLKRGNPGSETDTILTIDANGFLQLKVMTSYADDAAAAAGGIPIGGLYRNGSDVKVRVS